MENSLLDKRISRTIPVTSFNDKVIFPRTLTTKANGSFMCYASSNSSFFRKKYSINNELNHFNKARLSSIKDNLLMIDSNYNIGNVSNSSEQIEQYKQQVEPIKKQLVSRRMSTVQLILPFDIKKKLATLSPPHKQVLHLKSTTPDGTNIQRRVFQLREIQYVESLIKIIRKKKAKRSDLENAYNVLGDKMRELKKIQSKFNLNELARVREVKEEYKHIMRNRDKLIRSQIKVNNKKEQKHKQIKIIQELEFEQREDDSKFQQNSWDNSKVTSALPTQNYLELIDINIPSNENKTEGDQQQNTSLVDKKSDKQIENVAIKSKQLHPLISRKSKSTKKIVEKPKPQLIKPQPIKTKKLINKLPSRSTKVKKTTNYSSTRSDISNQNILPKDIQQDTVIQVKKTSDPEIQIDKQTPNQDDLVSKVPKISRRSSRFRFGEYQFVNVKDMHNNVEESNDISQISEESLTDKNNQEKLITINTVSSQQSKDQSIQNTLNNHYFHKNQPLNRPSQKYFKIAPKRRITQHIINNNIDLLNEDSARDEHKVLKSIENVRRGYRHGKRTKHAIRPEDEFIYLDINYNKSFVLNKQLLSHESAKLAKYIESKDVSLKQQQKQLLKPQINRQKNMKRQYVSSNMIQELSKQLKRSYVEDMNNNFYEFQGIRYSSCKKDKIEYYGISDYTYNEDPWFKRYERLEEKLDLVKYQDDLEQKQTGYRVPSTTQYFLNKIYKYH